ncbi:MAG TPA: ATP-grasp domain-containing protein [Ktedonobacterales bacterium]|nr:ATP-grasp domain-containing protein [Ktedonobacterales bacterium]
MRDMTRIPGVLVLGSDFKALGVIRSLGRHGIPSIVVDSQPRSAWFSRYVTRRVSWQGALEDPALADYLVQIGQELHLQDWMLVAAQDDAVGLVAEHRDTLAMIYRPTTPSWDVVRWAFDKRLTDRMARESAVAYPGTWYPAHESDLDQLDLRFPVIIKPAISIRMQRAARLKALPASNLDELHTQYGIATGMVSPDEIMVQEVIPGGGSSQVSVATLCLDGEIKQVMTARRLRQYPIDYGLGSSFVEAIHLPELIGPSERLLRYMRASGMVEVEFKQDPRDGVYKLLDINIRPWGWHTLCIACGLDLPYLQYQQMIGQPSPQRAPRYGTRWIRGATDLLAGVQEMRAGITTPWSYARSLLGSNTFSVLNWRDPLPAFGDLAVLAARFAHKPHAKEAYA